MWMGGGCVGGGGGVCVRAMSCSRLEAHRLHLLLGLVPSVLA